MKKNTPWIVAGILAILAICCIGTVAVYLVYSRGFINPAPTATSFFFPTPNETLTALYRPPTLALPTNTQYVAPTYSALSTSTGTITPTQYGITPMPSMTLTPGRATPSVNAVYFPKAPVLDGLWDEWPGDEHPITTVVYGGSNWDGSNDLQGSYKIGWDNNYLYLAIKVHDDRYVQVSTGEYIYKGDSLEILLDTNLAGDQSMRNLNGDDYQLGVSPGRNTVGTNMESYLWFPVSLTGGRSSVRIAAIGSDGLYRVEIAIPWLVFNVSPYKELPLGFAVSISDDDLAGVARQQTMISSSPYRQLDDPTTWGMLILK